MREPTEIRICKSPIVGDVQFQVVSSKSGNSNVVLCGEFERKCFEVIQLPFLSAVPGAPMSGRIRLHKIAAPSFKEAMEELHNSEHWPELMSYNGTFCPRLRRGSYDQLSNHALGLAVDMNAAWNQMNHPPAEKGAVGDMHNIAEIFKKHGWSWGGDWKHPDGMHLEYIGRREA